MQLAGLVRRVRGSAAAGSLVVMAGYLLSRISGLLRDIVVSARFGSSADYGAYVAAFRITDLLYMVIIGGALGSAFIPVFIQVWDRDGSERAWRLAGAVLTWSLGILALASAVLWLAAPWLTARLYSGAGFDARTLALTTELTRLFLLSPLLLGLGGLAMAALNARERFTLPALAPSIYNLGIIGGALVLAPWIGIWGLAWGVVIGALGYLLIQLPGLLRMGMRLRLTWGRGMREVRSIAQQMAPRVVGQSAAQVSILVTAALTAQLALGAERLAGLNYAYQLMLLPYGIFALSLSTVAFPRLARRFADNQHAELAADVRRTLGLILVLTIPAAAGLILLATPLVRAIFQRYAFDEISLRYTVEPLLGYALALPAFAAAEILIRTFYAMQRTLIPVTLGLLQVGINLALGSLALQLGGGTGALALAFSVANNLEALLLFLLLGRQVPGIWRNPAFRRSLWSALLATSGLAGWLWLALNVSVAYLPFLAIDGAYDWQRDLLPLLGWLLIVGGIGGIIWGGLAGLGGDEVSRRFLQRLARLVQTTVRGS